MKNYKQWTAQVRLSRLAEYKTHLWSGRVKPPGPCEICGQPRGTMHHAEDYGPTTQDYLDSLHSVCALCHAALHLRFRMPERWEEHKRRARLGPVQFAPSMGAAFQYFFSGGGYSSEPHPVSDSPQGGEWWELLSSERYEETPGRPDRMARR